ncbi:hypothetical protein FHS51_001414 [Sphingobium wenxiniae]|uniref:Uncharacterized protein n=1 Tax=Sphingobium wenxiniae (strain DSM 21828 / CGMCC 1.7748 / JZ-1) TaxID=595605 RepID=A0A562KKR3_SPHWJ|nr:hypothetical protein [Sphingobium wenxiniae]MBB6191192.1 hypothetical protein [Sphingobium wenxiniae]TWH96009.1 hypothetical protein IQ35_01098 [Sphingobium wenxiniae]
MATNKPPRRAVAAKPESAMPEAAEQTPAPAEAEIAQETDQAAETASEPAEPAVAESSATAADIEDAHQDVDEQEQVSGPVRWLRMTTSLSGPRLSLSRGDTHPFRDVPGPEGEPSEAQRLIEAGFGVECEPPKA